MIYEDECVPQAIMPNLNLTKIRGRIFFEEGEDDMSKVGAKPFIFMKTFFDGYEDFLCSSNLVCNN